MNSQHVGPLVRPPPFKVVVNPFGMMVVTTMPDGMIMIILWCAYAAPCPIQWTVGKPSRYRQQVGLMPSASLRHTIRRIFDVDLMLVEHRPQH